MPFYIVRNDITNMRVDAVVNAANPSLLGGGGVDGAIHRAAGPALRDYCLALGGCAVGQAVLTPGFGLPAPWIIHTVGPVWCGGDRGEEALLRACYRESLALALEKNLSSVAFPLLSAGVYGYPREQALSVAVSEIRTFLLRHEMEIWLVVYDSESYRLSSDLMGDIRAFIDETFVSAHTEAPSNRREHIQMTLQSMPEADFGASFASCPLPPAPASARPAQSKPAPPYPASASPKPAREKTTLRRDREKASEPVSASDLDLRLRTLDESFSQMLLRKIDEKGITDAACYKRANVDRKLFSKIRSDPGYRPSKPTAIAFAIALELPLEQTRELLMKAGYALSHSNKFDVIIEYFILRGNYDVFQINEALFAFDQSLLGA